MAEDSVVSNSAEFGQSPGKNNDEEAPIIVAQRFLNIFKQLHIFTEERKDSFNKMLKELKPEVRAMFKSLPGATPLQEYLDDLEGKTTRSLGVTTAPNSSSILQNAINEAGATPSPTISNAQPIGGSIIDNDNFAKILANSLAQSNAQIIKELQNVKPYAADKDSIPSTQSNAPIKLVADESFTKIISEALAEAVESSQKKHLEDNKVITQSFLELQENLTKLIEQNNQLKIISNSESPADAAAVFQVKNIVDDLVKAQSEFLKETTKSQKEELSQLISTAIKESQKLSTQSLVESLKHIEDAKGPTPITYAASSPKNQPSLESVEQALKAQGKEFSSIISSALKESQKNSAQTIIETIESLRKDTQAAKGSTENLKVEDIMKMQAELFRDITRAQQQEFSHLIAAALKESQRQSTETIVSALGQLQRMPNNQNVVYSPAPVVKEPVSYDVREETTEPEVDVSTTVKETIVPKQTIKETLSDETIIENNDDLLSFDDVTEDLTIVSSGNDDNIEPDTDVDSEVGTSKKKKKKKKKKNKNAENAETNDTPIVETPKPIIEKEQIIEPTKAVEQKVEKPIAKEIAEPSETYKPRKITVPTELPPLVNITDNDAQDWGWGYGGSDNILSSQIIENDDVEDITKLEDADIAPEWRSSVETIAETPIVASSDGQDWEWEYVEGEEGEDWEWEYEYEEVPEDELSGEEGEDWEWEYEYEEVPEEEVLEATTDENKEWEWEYDTSASTALAEEQEEYEYVEEDDIIEEADEQIIVKHFDFILLGLEDASYIDPYIDGV